MTTEVVLAQYAEWFGPVIHGPVHRGAWVAFVAEDNRDPSGRGDAILFCAVRPDAEGSYDWPLECTRSGMDRVGGVEAGFAAWLDRAIDALEMAVVEGIPFTTALHLLRERGAA